MDKNKHTPGPWRVMEGRTLLHIESDEDAPVAGEPVCSIPKSRPGDASLVAAAPDMLAALDAIGRITTDGAAASIARAALAKARGET